MIMKKQILEPTLVSTRVGRSEHTPADWRIYRMKDGVVEIADPNGAAIGYLEQPKSPIRSKAENEANARIMAAAPKLLAACLEALYVIEGYYDGAPDSPTRKFGFAIESLQSAINEAQEPIYSSKPMFYIEVAEGGPWLAQDLSVTNNWSLRGLWATEQQAAAARDKSLDTDQEKEFARQAMQDNRRQYS